MDRPVRILILEDNPTDAELMEYELKAADFQFMSRRVTTEESFVQGIQDFPPK